MTAVLDVTPFVRAQPAATPPPACSCVKTSTAAPVAVDGRVPVSLLAAALTGTRAPRIHIGDTR